MTGSRPRIVVGLTGGIAAYKVVSVIRTLVESGADVHVIPTESALHFIGKATLEAISRNPVHDSIFDGVAEVRHVAMGQSADAILIAPATANTLSALAEGRADSLLLTTVAASTAPLVVAPAMHTEMWEQPSTQANVATLVERGARFVGPVSGRLTGSDSGVGRLAEPEDITAEVLNSLAPKDLDGLRVLITAGGTREPIDPVRFIGNRSTGAMGVALADAAHHRGANVTLIAAHLEVPVPHGIRVYTVSTAGELHDAVVTAFVDADVFISSAAVSDYRVASPATEKLKKSAGVRRIGRGRRDEGRSFRGWFRRRDRCIDVRRGTRSQGEIQGGRPARRKSRR
jgi:phosphopantothenoylcysteine decarboxylase/phosphopantothenate--cysteine ligase